MEKVNEFHIHVDAKDMAYQTEFNVIYYDIKIIQKIA